MWIMQFVEGVFSFCFYFLTLLAGDSVDTERKAVRESGYDMKQRLGRNLWSLYTLGAPKNLTENALTLKDTTPCYCDSILFCFCLFVLCLLQLIRCEIKTRAMKLDCSTLIVFTALSSLYIVAQFKEQNVFRQVNIIQHKGITWNILFVDISQSVIRWSNNSVMLFQACTAASCTSCLLWGCFAFGVVYIKRDTVRPRTGHWLDHSKRLHCCVLALVQFLFALTFYQQTKKSKHEVIQTDK